MLVYRVCSYIDKRDAELVQRLQGKVVFFLLTIKDGALRGHF
jgi:hypothetical protein